MLSHIKIYILVVSLLNYFLPFLQLHFSAVTVVDFIVETIDSQGMIHWHILVENPRLKDFVYSLKKHIHKQVSPQN